jgi:hypothetical protein
MTIHKAKTSAYDSVTNNGIYHYIRQYINQIIKEVEPDEDGTGNDYKQSKRNLIMQTERN